MSKGRAQAIFKLSVGCWSGAVAQVGAGRTSPGGSVGALALPDLPRQRGRCGPRLSISSHWLGSHQDSPKRSVSGRFYHSDVQAYDLHEGHCIICVTLPPRARNPSGGTPFPRFWALSWGEPPPAPTQLPAPCHVCFIVRLNWRTAK